MSSVADQDILLEQEADERRIVEENDLARLLLLARQQRADAARATEAETEAQIERERAAASAQLVGLLSTSLGIVVPPERVWFDSEGDLWQRPVVSFAGRTFSYQRVASRDQLVVAVACTKCYLPLWLGATSSVALLGALEDTHTHTVCPETEVDDDFEIVEPKPSPLEVYTEAIKTRRVLQFERAKVKELAIRRILANKGVTFNGESFVAGSASAAEKLVEFDEGYAAHCAALTDAVVAEITAREALRAAGGGAEKEDEES